MQIVNQTELSQEEKHALAAEYARLVKHIALRMSAQLPAHIEVDDLIQDGVIGLMDALNRFDPSKRIKFQTFATTRIHGAMLDALRTMDWASRGARRRARELHLADEQLHQALGRQPNNQDLSGFTGLSLDELRRRKQEVAQVQLVRLDDTRSSSDESGDSLRDSLVDENANVVEFCFKAETKRLLLKALKTLPKRDQVVMNLYYFEEMNIRQIGAILGVSEARISQLNGRCMRRLRELLEPKMAELKPAV